MMKRNIKQQLNAKLTEMNMNLANNYKDLAHDALNELDRMVEDFKASGDFEHFSLYIFPSNIIFHYLFHIKLFLNEN